MDIAEILAALQGATTPDDFEETQGPPRPPMDEADQMALYGRKPPKENADPSRALYERTQTSDLPSGLDVVDFIGGAAGHLPGLPNYDPQQLRSNLNRMRTAAKYDPASFWKQVAGYAGDTMMNPWTGLAMGPVGAATKTGAYMTPAVLAMMGFGGKIASEAGNKEIARVGGNTKETPKSVDEYRAAVEKGEPIGPKYTLQEAIARSQDDGTSIRMRGNDVLPGDLDKTKGVSKYKQSGAYARLLNPGGEAAAQQMYLQAKNDVYARYKDAMKAAANNPSALKAIMEEVEKRASADALKTIPKEYRDSIVATSASDAEAPAEQPKEEESWWSAAAGPAAMVAGGTLLAYLLAKKFITPQQAEKIAGQAPSAAGLLAPSAKGLYTAMPKAVAGSADDVASVLGLPAPQLGLPGPQGKIPYIPQERAGPASFLSRVMGRGISPKSGPQINLGPEIEDAVAQLGLPGPSANAARITQTKWVPAMEKAAAAAKGEGSGPIINASRTIFGEAPPKNIGPSWPIGAVAKDPTAWRGAAGAPKIDMKAASRALGAIDSAIADRKASMLQLSKMGRAFGRDAELDRLVSLRQHLERLVR